MNTKAEVLEWAKRIIAKGSSAKPHDLLMLRSTADANEASNAFMKLARVAHPDLHRNTLDKTEFDLLVLAYSRVAGAYQELRTARPRPAGPAMGSTPAAPAAPAARPTGAPEADMNSKALGYFRKAEAAAAKGDMRGALLQLKMGIAADPQAVVLRTALAQVEAELKKK